MKRLILRLATIDEAKDLPKLNSSLIYFKHNLVYSMISSEEYNSQVEDHQKEYPKETPTNFLCPYTNLIGKLDQSFKGA